MRLRFIPFLALLLMTPMAHSQPAPQPAPKAELKIEPTFVDLSEMSFAGIAAYAGPASPRFPELWNDGFHDVMGDTDGGKGAEIGLETEKYAYGLELFPPSFEQKRKFTYLACFSVTDSRKVPLHLVRHTLPSAKYAVFKVPGGIGGLGEAFQFIYNRWLPQSGYDRAFPFDMERYDLPAGALNEGKPVVEILVPVVARK